MNILLGWSHGLDVGTAPLMLKSPGQGRFGEGSPLDPEKFTDSETNVFCLFVGDMDFIG